MRKYKNKIAAGAIIAIALLLAFWYGGNGPGLHGWKIQHDTETHTSQNAEVVSADLSLIAEADKEKEFEPEEKPVETPEGDTPKTTEKENNSQPGQEKDVLGEGIAEDAPTAYADTEDRQYSVQNGMVIKDGTGKDKYLTDPVPEGKPLPVEPQDVVVSDREYTCTLSVRCDTIVKNINWLDSEKIDIVPKDGIIFAEKTVTFYEGESVFDVLLREMKRNNIHMEFENTPIYNSAYIEGIANLYEFDCGERSGWMYRVNGWFPNYGCSRYQLADGDKIEWVYTCDLGVDVGGHYSAKGER